MNSRGVLVEIQVNPELQLVIENYHEMQTAPVEMRQQV